MNSRLATPPQARSQLSAGLASADTPATGGRLGFPSFRVRNARARKALDWARISAISAPAWCAGGRSVMGGRGGLPGYDVGAGRALGRSPVEPRVGEVSSARCRSHVACTCAAVTGVIRAVTAANSRRLACVCAMNSLPAQSNANTRSSSQCRFSVQPGSMTRGLARAGRCPRANRCALQARRCGLQRRSKRPTATNVVAVVVAARTIALRFAFLRGRVAAAVAGVFLG